LKVLGIIIDSVGYYMSVLDMGLVVSRYVPVHGF